MAVCSRSRQRFVLVVVCKCEDSQAQEHHATAYRIVDKSVVQIATIKLAQHLQRHSQHQMLLCAATRKFPLRLRALAMLLL